MVHSLAVLELVRQTWDWQLVFKLFLQNITGSILIGWSCLDDWWQVFKLFLQNITGSILIGWSCLDDWQPGTLYYMQSCHRCFQKRPSRAVIKSRILFGLVLELPN